MHFSLSVSIISNEEWIIVKQKLSYVNQLGSDCVLQVMEFDSLD